MESEKTNDQRRLVKICGGGVTRPNVGSKAAGGRLYEADQAFFQCGKRGLKQKARDFEDQAKAASPTGLHFGQT